MSLRVTPMTTQNVFIQALKSAGLLPSNVLSPRMVLARLVPVSPVSVMLTSAVAAQCLSRDVRSCYDRLLLLSWPCVTSSCSR